MPRPVSRQRSPLRKASFVPLWASAPIGCVSNETPAKPLTELDAMKNTSTRRKAAGHRAAALTKEREILRQQPSKLSPVLEQQRARLKAETADNAALATHLDQERPRLTAEGADKKRRSNRQIAVALHLKDLATIASQLVSTGPDGR